MEVIEKIERVRGRFHITLDSNESYVLNYEQLSMLNIREGEEVDPAAFREKIKVIQYRPALNKAVSMLALRPCSKLEIEKGLLRNHVIPETIELVLYKLEKEKLLNDRDFAFQWVRSRAGKKYGKKRLAYELKNKGISSRDIEDAIESLEEDHDFLQSATDLALKKLQTAKPDEDRRKIYNKVVSMLVRKGYDFDTANKAFHEAQNSIED